jgi:cobalt-zinc-cadmium efflux system protein
MAHNHHHDAHDHSHGDHGHVHPVTKNLKVAFFLNVTFTIIELIGGLLTNSMAILSDAIHDLGDSIAIGSALYLEKTSEKKRDSSFSYGYRRFSTLAAFINIVILTAGSVVIIYATIPRLLNPQEVHSQGMIALAVLGVIMNGLAVLRLKSDGKSLNNRTVMLHLMEDALGWVAVLIGAIVIEFTGWFIIDPLLSIGIAFYILYNALKNFKKVTGIFMQAVPKEINYNHIENSISKIVDIKEVHDIHIWSLDGEFNVASLHLVLQKELGNYNIEDVKKKVRMVFLTEGIVHVTIELEGPNEHCEMENCSD